MINPLDSAHHRKVNNLPKINFEEVIQNSQDMRPQ